MFTRTISKTTQKNLALLRKIRAIAPFYLAGGSAAALYLGHRFSFDLDFFTPHKFKTKELIQAIARRNQLSIETETEDSLIGRLNKLKISFFYYPYALILPPKKFLGIQIADIIDIACMKIDAISSRGKKRDFIDLYFICQEIASLSELLRYFQKKYWRVDYNLIHIQKSLIYFRDAEQDEMPKMFKKVSWREIKKFFEEEVKKNLGF